MRCICLLFFFFTMSAMASESHERLQRVEELALSDWNTAKSLLAGVDESTLSPADKGYFRYLSLYMSTKDMPLQAISDGYKALLIDLPDDEIKVKTAKSLLALSAYINDWDYAFNLSKELERILVQLDNPKINLSAWKGMLVFYSQAGQNDIALDIANRILTSPERDSVQECFALSFKGEIELHEHKATEAHFDHAIDVCKKAGQSFYVTYNFVYLMDHFIENKEFSKATLIEQEASWRVEQTNFLHMTTSFQISQAQLRMAEGNLISARTLATEAIQSDVHKEFTMALKEAYELLVTVATKQQDYQAAFENLQKVHDIEKTLTADDSIKQLAFLKANFALREKESQIALLDKQNKLLHTEATLNGQKIKSTLLALALVSVAGVILLLWSYRSRRLARKMRYLATRDNLTTLYNRGYFTDIAAKRLVKAQKHSDPVAMILLDLDLFKVINDTYGHQVGDWVLREVSKVLLATVGDKGIVVRMGGEEFGILAEGLTVSEANLLAEQCRTEIANIDSSLSGHYFDVTASFGVSDTRQVGFGLDNLFSASDLALYKSKKYGRNRVYNYDIGLNAET